jgi:hypothetical protein
VVVLPQLEYPALQLMVHDPLTHPGCPFDGSVQILPQLPQFLTSEAVFTHRPLQSVSAPQFVEHVPPAQTGDPLP